MADSARIHLQQTEDGWRSLAEDFSRRLKVRAPAPPDPARGRWFLLACALLVAAGLLAIAIVPATPSRFDAAVASEPAPPPVEPVVAAPAVAPAHVHAPHRPVPPPHKRVAAHKRAHKKRRG